LSKAKASYSVSYWIKDAAELDGLRREHFHIKAWSDAEAITEGKAAVMLYKPIRYEVQRETKKEKSVIFKSPPAA
jgi:hypothetical protein